MLSTSICSIYAERGVGQLALQRTKIVFCEASYLLVCRYFNLRASRGCFSYDEMEKKKRFLCVESLILLLPLALVLKNIKCLAYFHLPLRQHVPKVKYTIRSPLINVPFVSTSFYSLESNISLYFPKICNKRPLTVQWIK